MNATDNVQVANVLITILDDEHSEGGTQEHGQAVMLSEARWEYKTSVEGRVIIEAFDLAGNGTRQEVYPSAKQNVQ